MKEHASGKDARTGIGHRDAIAVVDMKPAQPGGLGPSSAATPERFRLGTRPGSADHGAAAAYFGVADLAVA